MDIIFSRTKKIPANRFGRECSLCSSRHGVPIECSARGCKVAYHTTCAIRGKLKMQAIFGTSFKGGIKLRSYCHEHSPTANVNNGDMSLLTETIDTNDVKEIDMTNLADDRLQERNEELDYFWKYVDINQVQKMISDMYARPTKVKLEISDESGIVHNESATPKKKKKSLSPLKIETPTKRLSSPKKVKAHLDEGGIAIACSSIDDAASRETDPLVIDLIYRYWMLLRTANNGQSLIKFSPSALKEREFEQRKSIMKLRIELERVRNLSYMIGKREKLKASWLRTHHNIIKRTFNIINDLKPVTDDKPTTENSGSSDSPTHNDHQNNQNNHAHMPAGKKSLHQTQHVQPTNGMFDESDQLINDLITCDQIYDLPNVATNSNFINLSYQERCTLERRRTLSLVRRINRQLKNISIDSSLNPYKKSYLVPKRSDSPIGQDQAPTTKMIKYR